MSDPITLLIGNKNYSSWSLRGWLALRLADLDFAEKMMPLDAPDFRETFARETPAGQVPVMIEEDGTTVWDTLAIIERCHERAPHAHLWPTDDRQRAMARSIAAEMHAGFSDLRNLCPMNLRRPPKMIDQPEQIESDVARFHEIVKRYRTGDSPYLFAHYGAADIMLTPLASRLPTYAVATAEPLTGYVEALLTHPLFEEWKNEALKEIAIVDMDEV